MYPKASTSDPCQLFLTKRISFFLHLTPGARAQYGFRSSALALTILVLQTLLEQLHRMLSKPNLNQKQRNRFGCAHWHGHHQRRS